MKIYLVRHGQSEYNIGLSDNLDSNLTPLGQQQADAAADYLRNEQIEYAYVSPLRRTLQTIGPICRASGIKAELLALACEFFSMHHHEYYSFQGLSTDEIVKNYPWVSGESSLPCDIPWWPQVLESNQMLIRRVEKIRDFLLNVHGGTDHRILIVSHADTLGRLKEAFLHTLPYPQEPPWLDNCGVTLLTQGFDTEKPAHLVYDNETSYLHTISSFK